MAVPLLAFLSVTTACSSPGSECGSGTDSAESAVQRFLADVSAGRDEGACRYLTEGRTPDSREAEALRTRLGGADPASLRIATTDQMGAEHVVTVRTDDGTWVGDFSVIEGDSFLLSSWVTDEEYSPDASDADSS
ncbi:hypothetical protein HNR23_003287 [Nocardiopsis mwathae]|uniref:Uncharacterized protein n=1 Tax=Nocardiopsis mwathae TaxID=1472723 RepID=A0A7W9YJI2_9ACTN|nr:hypothetical protein [Nocardiopsis mwathae]MBB6173227.1 hypothetical protein [Nocardiopsis mwathae]